MARRGPLLRATAAALLLGAAALFSTCMGDTPGPAADPGVLRQALELCGSAADCADDGDPCTEALCAGGECRHLPVFEGCCTGVEDCIPASPCLLAQCVLGETVGSCQDVPDPMKPGCCSTEADCPAPPVGEIYLCAKEEGALFKTCVATVDPNLCQPLSGAGVVINEFMNNPEAHDDTTGEWIELYNTSLTPVNLHGWVLADEGADNHVIQAGGGLVVPGGGYLLLARSNNPQANGGLDVDYVYYNYILSNGADEIILRNPQGVQMDRVEFGGTFAMVPGASMQLANPSLDNNSPVNWFPASLPWGAGSDRGTPGAPNTDGFFLYFTSPVCDDDNPCTLDTCGQGGAPLCRHDSIFDCCLFPVDCNDHDVCTLDVCQPQSLTCSHQPLPGCCNGDSQCADGNPCTLDLCGNHVCHNPVNPETPGCCISDAGCVDVNPCTIDFCKQEPLNPYKTCHHSSPGGKQCCLVDQDCVDELPETIDTCTGFQCQHAVDPEYCLAGPPQYCDDGDPCTQDQCDLVSHLCLHTPVPECCKAPGDCGDGNVCTQDICQLGPHVCTHAWIPWCCQVPQDCVPYMTDIDNCKVPACVDHECRLLHIPQESCCIVDEDCEDGDACTEDICNPGNNLCSHLPKGKGCCNDEGDCLEDDDPCTRVSCIADECIYQSLQGCCMGDWQCDDGGACTLDLCVDYECRFLPGLKAGCCVEDGDCPWPKGPCQDAWCGPEGTCEEGPTPACELALDHAELFNDHLPLDALGWSVTGPAPAAWAAAFGGGPLGPDGRRVLTLAGGDGPLETCLVSPAFTGAAGGFASVTWEQWIEAPASNPEGLLRLEAWPAALAGETEVLWSAQPASGVVNRRDPWTAALPLKIAAGTFRLAFCADLPAVATPFQWSVDNVFVGAGRPPEIQGATEPVLLQPGQKATLPILVKDDDSPPPVQAYVTGPAHATLGSRKPGPGPELTLVKIDLRPVAEIDVGEWEVRVTVTDGFFYDRAWIEETVYVALCDTDAECDDLNDCSQDWCDPFLGCQHLFAPGCCNELTPCDDGSACTVDTCVEGTCAVAPLECNDSNLCTNDLCDPATGCLYPFNALACDDGSVCTVDDHCSLGTCTGDPLDCGDGLDCTLDTCDPVEGCHSTPICDDGIFCTTDACTPLGCYSGKSPAWTPVLDGLLDGDWPPWSVLATKSDPFKPIHLHAQVDAGHLYLALDMVPGEGEALLVFVDRDFGAGTGYASLAEIPSGGGMQPLDAALPVDLAVSLPGFGADLALGSVGGAQVVGMAPDAGARVLLPGGPEAVPATVLGEPALGEMEMALAWSVLLPGEDLSGEILALLVVLVDLDDLSTPWQLPYTPFGQLTAVSFVGVPGPACLLPVCGDAVMDQGESCDEGPLNSDIAPDACRLDCSLPACGDGTKDSGEECDNGPLNSDVTPDACRLDCSLSACGDGVKDSGEACDDGSLNSDVTPDACRLDCALPACGDGVKDSGEACDDGNTTDFDGGCQGDCTVYVVICGDGILDGSEECDDGPLNSDDTPDACRLDCSLPACGDGTLDTGEGCDDGNLEGNDTCGLDCQPYVPGCGNGWIDGGEACDDGPLNSDDTPDACRLDCSLPACGDGVKDTGEACDQGLLNADDTPDACRTDCSLPFCGDGVADPLHGEICDQGPLNSDDTPDACRTDCTPPFCGDGIVDSEHGEACDTGPSNSDLTPNACRTDCALPFCGDGVTDSGEECDDGNEIPDDGCNPGCVIEVYIPEPGDIIITEIMQNPASVYDTLGEYFEVHNTRTFPIDINGWEILDEGADYHKIVHAGPLWVPAGGFRVLGLNDDPLVNGGVPVDYEYGTTILLGNGADEVLLSSGGIVSDEVAYDGGIVFPDPNGRSMNLSPGAFSHTANDAGPSWCATATGKLAGGDWGTPGAANESCP